MSAIEQVEYLYCIVPRGDDPDDRDRVMPLRVVKKTPKRIYFRRWLTHDIGYVDRQAMEASGADGCSARKRTSWWDPDAHLYLEPPQLDARGRRVDTTALKAELSRLKAEMAAAHPDVGGTHEAFLAAHKRWNNARNQFARLVDVPEAGA
ncbi:hypothetical protein O7626_40770 [Micromonospora sp. WMMD1102]|uniref:hypothetical protein n=1 Tax=Micromonospora sp. WMMD1102 TaxID=3016105 RepID=UPI002414FCE2|nr:hypothetical protein [Micromonospora sp. WMMD1102]MDG4790384.1 hypothetical protein [Micromonospora sp. WMMD1102]MDG4792138.1 hypothetical protein [Micromonospora sp. WMMD1102]